MVTHNLSRTVAELLQLIQILDTLRFGATLWGLRKNVQCSSWAHWKARSGLPISVNWTFFARGYTAKALPAKIDRKSAISLQRGQFDPKFQVEGDVSTDHFAWIVRPMNLPLTFFTQRNFVADFLQENCDYRGKTAVYAFLAPFGYLGVTYDDHLMAHWKARSGLPISVNWTFSLDVTSEALRAITGSKIGDFAPTGVGWPKISGRKGRPHQPFFFSEN